MEGIGEQRPWYGAVQVDVAAAADHPHCRAGCTHTLRRHGSAAPSAERERVHVEQITLTGLPLTVVGDDDERPGELAGYRCAHHRAHVASGKRRGELLAVRHALLKRRRHRSVSLATAIATVTAAAAATKLATCTNAPHVLPHTPPARHGGSRVARSHRQRRLHARANAHVEHEAHVHDRLARAGEEAYWKIGTRTEAPRRSLRRAGLA
mmetsp:Transcript_31017/g.75898  ORF Transcript_31017/g.75898 Transcript_31017/m.75898 type:complete len:209 (-) Transcript_31017:221-847(-)